MQTATVDPRRLCLTASAYLTKSQNIWWAVLPLPTSLSPAARTTSIYLFLHNPLFCFVCTYITNDYWWDWGKFFLSRGQGEAGIDNYDKCSLDYTMSLLLMLV